MNRADDWSETPPERAASDADHTAGPTRTAGVDLARVGDHIASVLGAAETAAANLRAAAEQDAAEVRLAATHESEAARASAREIVSEAEGAGTDIRAEADRYAEDRRHKADEHAAKIVSEAKRNAAAIAETSQERHRVVLTNIATAEGRLRDLAKSLRAVASALDSVVGDGPPTKDTKGDLAESLRPRVQAARSGGANS